MRTVELSQGQGILVRMASLASGRRTLTAALFVLLTTAGAYVAVPVPWTPVPMTLQPLFVLLSGLVLGPSAGAASMAAYVLLGVGGAPVFAAIPAGPAALVGPTGGFILAFPLASGLCGWLAGPRDAGAPRILLALVAGLLVIYLAGATQLALLTGAAPTAVFRNAVLPFALGDSIELLLAMAIALRLRSRARDDR
ncbi:MAG: biotin transporter BioY [Gammaproteobacteria bacterium]|nr:biotin transporter BioY [Gammaproteobacteria bacterium]MDE0260755.1 biotin transporter BioY [Gammaproteobacteria bacterium]